MKQVGELLVWFLLGAILVNIVMHAPQFTAASNATFGFVNGQFAGLVSRK